jgi:hypothetical protein
MNGENASGEDQVAGYESSCSSDNRSVGDSTSPEIWCVCVLPNELIIHVKSLQIVEQSKRFAPLCENGFIVLF